MKKIIYLLATIALTLACTKYDDPAPYTATTRNEVVADGYTIVTINELKAQFYDLYGSTKYAAESIALTQKVAICGKVISSDKEGNIYRSLYIQDEKGYDYGAIELKIGKGSLYNEYKAGQTIYVKTDGLVLGNYRFMLSLGAASEDASYTNGYIDSKSVIEQHILKGELTSLTAADTLVVNSSTIATKLKDPQHLGCLVRFEGIKSTYGTVQRTSVGNGTFYSETDIYPSYLESIDSSYATYTYEQKGLPNTWAYKYDENGALAYYYGSALFTMSVGSEIYPYVIRSSAYSRFALHELPAKDQMVDLTAIYTKYCSSGGGYAKYQLLLNSDSDVRE